MKISLSKLSTKELATLAETVISISKNEKYTMVKQNELLKNLNETFEGYRNVYNKLSFSGKGKSVAEADKKRDVLYNKLRDYIKSYAGLEQLPHTEKAQDLYAYFKLYGTQLATLNYAEETAQLRKFIEDLSQDKNLLKLEALGIKAVFLDLKQAQDEFDVIYSEQITSNSELRSIPSASKSRRELEEYLKAYFVLVTAMQKTAEWKPLYDEINELVKSIKPAPTVKKEEEKK